MEKLNTTLLIAIEESGYKKSFLAEKINIPAKYMKSIVHGKKTLTQDQKEILAKLLSYPIERLFVQEPE
jgi:plasmid maintenance system antidote protein VapI